MGMGYSSCACVFTLKVLVISGVVLFAAALRSSVPAIVAAFKPPYIYVILNAIIVTIAASSRYRHQEASSDFQATPEQLSLPLASSSFCYPTPQGTKALVETQENETLEQTWKMIMWNNQINAGLTKKSKTSIGDPTPSYLMELKKDRSLSQDEFNHRVEAFINQFKEEMRLQRQESLNKFKES